MKEYRAKFVGENGQECHREFDTMEQAQDFYDSHIETVIQKFNPAAGTWEDVVYPTYEF